MCFCWQLYLKLLWSDIYNTELLLSKSESVINSLNLKFAVKLGLLRVVGCSCFDKRFICLRSMYVCMHSDAVDLNIVT